VIPERRLSPSQSVENSVTRSLKKALPDAKLPEVDPADPFAEIKAWASLAPPSTEPRAIRAHHSVPLGRIFRQWNAAGELHVWVNRGEIHDLPRAKKRPDSVLGAALSGIPVWFE